MSAMRDFLSFVSIPSNLTPWDLLTHSAHSSPQLRVSTIHEYLPLLFGLNTAIRDLMAAQKGVKVDLQFSWTSGLAATAKSQCDFFGELVFVLTILAISHRNTAAELVKEGQAAKEIISHLRNAGGIFRSIGDLYLGRWEGASKSPCPESQLSYHKLLASLCFAEAQLFVAQKASAPGLQLKLLMGAQLKLADSVDQLAQLRGWGKSIMNAPGR